MILISLSGAETTEWLLTTLRSEMITPGPLRTEGKSLVDMRVSQSHTVASANDKLVIRVRALLSHTPNPAPITVTSADAVSTEADEQLMIPFCVGKNPTGEYKCATALLSTVNAKLRMLPSEGD